MGTFYIIPHGTQITVVLCQLLKKILPHDYSIGHSTIVLPSHNATFYLKNDYIKTDPSARFVPKITSLKSLIHEKVFLNAPPPDNIVYGWEKLGWLQNHLKSFFKDLRSSQRLEVAQSLLEVMDELQKHHVPGESIGKLLPYASSDKWQNSLDILFNVMTQWQKFLHTNKKIEEYEYYERGLKHISDNLEQYYGTHPFVWVGMRSNDLSNMSESRIDFMKRILNLPQGHVIFEENLKGREQSFILEKIPHPSVFYHDADDTLTAQRKSLIKKSFLNHEGALNTLENTPTMLESSTAYEEAKLIALIVRYHLHHLDKTISIVTKSKQLAKIIEGELARWKVTVNNAMGISFPKTVMGVFLTILSGLWAEQSWFALVNLLKHPLCLKNNRGEILKLVRYLDTKILRSPRLVHETWETLTNILPQDLKATWEYFLSIVQPILSLKGKHPLGHHLKLHESVTQKLIGEDFNRENDGATAKTFFDEVSNFSACYELFDENDYPKAFETLIRKLDTVYFHDSINRSVRILRPDEALWFRSDVVILSGLNEGSWPNLTSQDEQWLSHGMRAKLGVSNVFDNADWDTHDFCHLLSGKKVYLTRSNMEDQKPTIPSRFWRRIQWALSHQNMNESANPWMDWLRHINCDSINQTIKITPPEANPSLSVRPKKVSATEVELLLRDPYGLYIKRCLKLKPLEPLSTDITHSQKGQIFHHILHDFIKNYPNHPVNPLEFEQLVNKHLSFLKNYNPHLYFLMNKKILKIINFVVNDLNKKHPHQILSEVRGEYSFACSGAEITLSATADRIDIWEDRVDIIDYKNGTPPSIKSVNDLRSPQLMIEAILLRKNSFHEGMENKNIAASYWHLKSDDTSVEITSLNIQDEFLNQAESDFIRLLDTMLCQKVDMKAYPYPEDIPPYHPYTHLERLNEWNFS